MRHYFSFGQPRLFHRLKDESPEWVTAYCGVKRANNGSIRWSLDPRSAICKDCASR